MTGREGAKRRVTRLWRHPDDIFPQRRRRFHCVCVCSPLSVGKNRLEKFVVPPGVCAVLSVAQKNKTNEFTLAQDNN